MSPRSTTAEKVVDFARLPNGWHYGSGRPPLTGTVLAALRSLERLHRLGVETTDAFPGEEGEILLSGCRGGSYLEILVRNDGCFDLTAEEDGEEIAAADGLGEEDVFEKLREVVGRLWNSSGSSIPVTMTRSVVASRALPFEIRAAEAHQSSRWSALKKVA